MYAFSYIFRANSLTKLIIIASDTFLVMAFFLPPKTDFKTSSMLHFTSILLYLYCILWLIIVVIFCSIVCGTFDTAYCDYYLNSWYFILCLHFFRFCRMKTMLCCDCPGMWKELWCNRQVWIIWCGHHWWWNGWPGPCMCPV